MEESRERIDDEYWLLEMESNLFITAALSSLSQLKLERSVHSKAVKELGQAINTILGAYRKGNIDFDSAQGTLRNLKHGFVDGVRSIRTADRNRVIRNQQRMTTHQNTDSSYRRSMRVNNQAFNVRFKARCATPECLMRSANFDLEDDAFQDYIEAALQDKKSDLMEVASLALIAAPYAKPLEYLTYADISYSFAKDSNITPALAALLGKGMAYRLKLLSATKGIQARGENATSYITGKSLDGKEIPSP
ncbi:hypothetical protein [Vibrio atlanticus]|uniref:hypothetical protein n=1 Tax=Vibrio atlanticus TaxID=693153 RepID=UPI00355394F0